MLRNEFVLSPFDLSTSFSCGLEGLNAQRARYIRGIFAIIYHIQLV